MDIDLNHSVCTADSDMETGDNNGTESVVYRRKRGMASRSYRSYRSLSEVSFIQLTDT
jgi:hypothetical protein